MRGKCTGQCETEVNELCARAGAFRPSQSAAVCGSTSGTSRSKFVLLRLEKSCSSGSVCVVVEQKDTYMCACGIDRRYMRVTGHFTDRDVKELLTSKVLVTPRL